MEPDETGIRYRGHSASDYMEGFNYELDAADRAGYSCGSFLAAIKIVGLSFRFISSSLGSIGSAITPSFFSRKSIEDKSSEERPSQESETVDHKSLGLSEEELEKARLEQLKRDWIQMGLPKAEFKKSSESSSSAYSSGSGATGGAFGEKEFISLERYERLDLSRFKNRAGSYDSKAAIEYLYSTKLSNGESILYPMPDNIIGGIKGIENGNNSCTIASLLFNMFGATSFFDKLLLVGPEIDKTDKDIRFQLIEIANDLRVGDRKVTAEKLVNLRNLVMGGGSGFLQPDEFLDPLFKKLKINAENEFTFLDMREKETSGMDAIIEQIVSDHSEKIRPLEDVVNMQDFMEREDQIRNNYETAIAS
ncbi:MAG: hypothetical protein K940chlam5_01737, partial [Candidatus Anoxychlamydiales bacterium]|nr:hypothetical protein [Candidatus Anoxychlamydiales bacterium]